jgi:hypothetical protein
MGLGRDRILSPSQIHSFAFDSSFWQSLYLERDPKVAAAKVVLLAATARQERQQ